MEPHELAQLGDAELSLRLGIAAFAGLALGLDRELKGVDAGLRTHAIVSLSSAVITVSALMLYQTLDNTQIDPLRVVQGLAQAIGFIGAGMIFVSRGDVRNLTSAANLWLAAACGVAAGAGQYLLVGLALGFGLFIVVVLRGAERLLLRASRNRREASGRPRG